MKTIMIRATTLALLLAGSGAAFADVQAIRDEAEINGLSEREMRMLSGAPSSYANYRTSYWQARDKLRRQALADERYFEERAARSRRESVEVAPVQAVEREPADTAETYALPED